MSTTRVSVIGASGRMGSTVCRAVEDAGDLELVGRFDEGDDLGDLAGADVVVEFSVPDASPANVAHCVARGVHVVVGTTGWSEERLTTLRGQLGSDPRVGVLIAPNFAIGAVLMMAFAEQAARFYESVEVVELHHPDKVDAPSGTAVRTADLIGAAREDAGLASAPDATTHDPDGARRARARHPRALRPAARPRGTPGGPPRRPRGAADGPPRLLRPGVVHAGCPGRGSRSR
jgi:4-hydroxy-tetrahydrodipicolinate reductase